MVFLSRILNFAKGKHTGRKYLRTKFLDSLRLTVIGGSGGTGLPAYGGSGGQGGCVYCVGKPDATLKQIYALHRDKRVVAGHGHSSHKNKLTGAPGEDQVLPVPLGLQVYTDAGKLGEINAENETLILARGGPGGAPANDFLGREGQQRTVLLELRLIADVGLVGFPNAGKSTLLKGLSRAKPKIASYPFTTIKPNIGIIEFPDHRQISMADLPGLVEGAHINIGMGHRFLRHVERTRLLMLVVDIQGFALSLQHKHRSCFETILLLNKEIELYNPELLQKPALLVVNKMDTQGAEHILEELHYKLNHMQAIWDTIPSEIRPEQLIKFEHISAISAQTSPSDVLALRDRLRLQVDLTDEQAEDAATDLTKDIQRRLKEKGPALT